MKSPGVFIREVDRTINLVSGGNRPNVLVLGFSSGGPVNQILNVTSIAEFESIYGKPSNEAERYFFHSVLESLKYGNVQVSRLPYGEEYGQDGGNDYTVLAFPILGIPDSSGGTTYASASALYIGRPFVYNVSDQEISDLISSEQAWADSSFTTSTFSNYTGMSSSGLIFIDLDRGKFDSSVQGSFIGLADTLSTFGSKGFQSIKRVHGLNSDGNSFNQVLSSRFSFYTDTPAQSSSQYVRNSLSEDLEFMPFVSDDYVTFKDCVKINEYRIENSKFDVSPEKLSINLNDSWFGSFNPNRTIFSEKDNSFQTFFLESFYEEGYGRKVWINPNIKNSYWNLSANDNPDFPNRELRVYKGADFLPPEHYSFVEAVSSWFLPCDGLYPTGLYYSKSSFVGNKKIGNLPEKMRRVLQYAANSEITPIDIVIDGGLSTIWASVNSYYLNNPSLSSESVFDLNRNIPLGNIYVDGSGDYVDSWKTVQNIFLEFCKDVRRDCIFVSDPPRHLFIQGEKKVMDENGKNFAQHIYEPLKNIYGSLNTNYACAYANWEKHYDYHNDLYYWKPFSGKIARLFCKVDLNAGPWFAPAGLSLAFFDCLDIAWNPSRKNSDMLYAIGINPIGFSIGNGVYVLGQKTLQRKPYAFDRINVRRLFIYVQKYVKTTLKYFVFDANTSFNRSRVINTLSPLFESIKSAQGIYEYEIVCDERNNTPDVIDRNEMKVDIYIKPVRTAEFIKIDFIAQSTKSDL